MAQFTDEQKHQIKLMICEILEIDPDELTPASHFIDDHGADSLRAIEILANLEVTFGVTIDQSELGRMTTLDNVYKVLEEVELRA